MSRRQQAGFTVTELMTVIALTAIVAASTGALYLQVRTAAARTEALVSLERRAALVLEWIGRDLRGGTPVDNDAALDTSIRIRRAEGFVTYTISDRRIVRRSGDRRRVLARGARELRIRPVERGHRIDLHLEQPIARGQRIKTRRSTFIGARR